MSELLTEKWLSVVGFESLYEVSDLGRVRSLPGGHRKGDVLNPAKRNKDYWTVSLFKDGVSKQYLIHRLVAIAHIPNPENKPVVNHKNGITHENMVSNLEWNTVSENTKHGYAVLGRQVLLHPNRQKQVATYIRNNNNRTHCKHGHALTTGNTYYRQGNTFKSKICRTCKRMSQAKYILGRATK